MKNDILVAAEHAILEGIHSLWTWAIIPCILGLDLVLFSGHAASGGPAAWSATIDSAKLGALVLGLWISSGALSSEAASGRRERRLSAGVRPAAYVAGFSITWLLFLWTAVWIVGGVTGYLFLDSMPPQSVLAAIAVAPLNGTVLCCLGLLLSAVLPRRLNTMLLVLLLLAPPLVDRVAQAYGLSLQIGRTLTELILPANRIHSAASPNGVVFYDTAGWKLAGASATAAILLLATAACLGRARLRSRLA